VKHALVIGGGFGGMAIALRLRAKNYKVTVLDRSSMLGGRGQVFERNGFKHDAGPTVITAPFLLEELFELFDEKLEDHIKLVPLTPWYRFYFSDKTTFDYGGTLDETLVEIDKISPKDAKGYLRLLKHSEKIFNVAFVQLSSVPFNHFFKMLALVPKLIALKSYETVWRMVCRYLTNNKLRQAFSIQPLLVGGNPFSTTSIYGLIHYLERAYGVFFAMGGTGAIVSALSDLMKRNGIEILLNTTVNKVVIENGEAKKVILADGSSKEADLIVSNADPTYLYENMVDQNEVAIATKVKLKIAHYSMGLFVVYFGSTKKYNDIAHHTIWLGKTYKELLHDIFDTKILSKDFSLYLHRPTATDASFAPEGCDSFYVLCPVPNLQGSVNWEIEGEQLKKRIIDALSTHGAGFSIAPIFRQSAWFRFHNKSEKIKNLYIVGAGTHPGAGLPGVLCSAKVVDSILPKVN
jgi:phytoene desaturase